MCRSSVNEQMLDSASRLLNTIPMKTDEDKIEDAVLALLQLTAHGSDEAPRAWKGHSWEVMDRLYEKGWISNPKGKAKSVAFTEEGWKRSQELFKRLFGEEE
jgi:hypothetical protein